MRNADWSAAFTARTLVDYGYDRFGILRLVVSDVDGDGVKKTVRNIPLTQNGAVWNCERLERLLDDLGYSVISPRWTYLKGSRRYRVAVAKTHEARR